jgi:hypothetical protein
VLPAWVWCELLVDLVDELEVEVEQSAHERGHEQEVLLADAVVDALGGHRAPHGGYLLENTYHELLARA